MAVVFIFRFVDSAHAMELLVFKSACAQREARLATFSLLVRIRFCMVVREAPALSRPNLRTYFCTNPWL